VWERGEGLERGLKKRGFLKNVLGVRRRREVTAGLL
jgi:hypothetical protein